jgi:hypothetical protein
MSTFDSGMKSNLHTPNAVIDRFVALLDICRRINSEKNFDELLNMIAIDFDARLGIAGAVIKTGKTMMVEDAYNSPLFYPAIDSQTGFHTRNITLCSDSKLQKGSDRRVSGTEQARWPLLARRRSVCRGSGIASPSGA